ncbi:hypothetical protein [Mycobacteroides abscessus]|uniref:hypothetical protein n=1 Tax=Mycobacteroides abscessus TaxID=36809 RepID=UPI0009A6EB24|nr:hypothetical protein [Mycobacteroides abscessus]SKO15716.1 Uncharacterised protein [Mycobacteroides abscessus subsp. bolletii]SKX37196.1 Uncharacterised protein [Mycobacteroides abscessus subsp. bolletii]
MNLSEIPPDRYDTARRAWIARHGNVFNFQKRRAQLLGRQIRERIRANAGARPEEQDDFVIDPIWYRRPTTLDAFAETGIIGALLLLAPIGWLMGRWLYGWIIKMIPDKLSAYPITALTWSGVPIGAILCLAYDHGHDLGTAVGAAWVLAQIPATFLAAGIYGILNGWLAVDGSADIWPMTPLSPGQDDVSDLKPIELTGANPFGTESAAKPPRQAPRPKTRRPNGNGIDNAWIAGIGVSVAVSAIYVYLVLGGVSAVVHEWYNQLPTLPGPSYTMP